LYLHANISLAEDELMDTKSRLALAAGAATCLALVIMDRVAGRKKQLLVIEQDMPSPAARVLDAVKQVEREPEMIPIVSSVEILSKTDAEVNYTVRTKGCCPATVRYRKWWDESIPAVYWRSVEGTAGFHHEGSIHFTEKDGKSVAYLMSWHWVTAPLVGRLTTPMLKSVIKAELEAWLRNIADELTKRSD
jgi:hypothetical protein